MFFRLRLAKQLQSETVTLTAIHLDSYLNSGQLALIAKFKIVPKWATVKVTPLTKVALGSLASEAADLAACIASIVGQQLVANLKSPCHSFATFVIYCATKQD